VTPGSDFTFTALLYDQAGDGVSDDVTVVIYYPNGTLIEKRLARAGKAESLTIGQTDVPGYWKIDAATGKLEISKTFYVEELQKAEFSIANDTLTIANAGNVDYTKAVEITIGDKKEIIQVNVSVGGIRKFKLYAPEGEYEISVNDGSQTNNFGTSFLTGRAISVQDITNLTSSMPFLIVVWIIVILIVAAIALYIYRKVARGSYSGRMPSFARSEENRPTMLLGTQKMNGAVAAFGREEKEERESVAPATSAFNQDEQRMRQRITSTLPSMAPPFVVRKEKEEYAKSSATMERAQKQESSIVCLNVRNMAELMTSKGGALGALDRALSKAKSTRAKIYIDGNYRVIIFAPAITRESANETRAINAAKQIEEVLTEYNKLHVQKVEFGIGVNSGELIAESRDGGFKFTSVGNTISAAKRISDNADSEILLSELFHRKTAGTVKVEPEKGAWKIKRIVNRDRNSEFINKFMDRQKKQR
jgi:class 3 adenylate cyclase